MKILAENSKKIKDNIIYISLFQLHKSFLLLISDQEDMGIGNVTLSSPPTIEGINSTTASYDLFGIKEKLLSKIIAEKASRVLKAPVLLLLFLKRFKNEEELAKPLIDFLNEVFKDVTQKMDSV